MAAYAGYTWLSEGYLAEAATGASVEQIQNVLLKAAAKGASQSICGWARKFTMFPGSGLRK